MFSVSSLHNGIGGLRVGVSTLLSEGTSAALDLLGDLDFLVALERGAASKFITEK